MQIIVTLDDLVTEFIGDMDPRKWLIAILSSGIDEECGTVGFEVTQTEDGVAIG